jgi:serine-type D-Ala-D-Ala carboxypeptidase/endopeptidase (penicillin-binding protein 4)
MSAAALTMGCASSRGPGRLASLGPVADLRHTADSLVNDPMFRTALWGILVVDPERGDTLYAHNASKLFIPASNQKILIASTALKHLGPDFRFTTTFASTGPVEDGTLRGDLIVTGSGDPTVSDHMATDAMTPMRAIADSLAARGVKRITGGLLRSGDAFPGPAVGSSWPWSSLDSPSFAGIDELTFNEGLSRVIIKGGVAPGERPTVSTAPARTFPRVVVMARTAPEGTPTVRRGPGALRARQDSTDLSTVVVDGEIAAGDSAVLTITQREPSVAYLSALREALTEKGITVDGQVSRSPAPAGTYPLFTITSAPLRDILGPFLKPSQNQIGEILIRAIGRARTGVGSVDSGAAVVRAQVVEWGGAPDGVIVRDGSGLSRDDLVSPETLVRVLNAIRADTAYKVFYDALPIAGVDGTIGGRMRGTPAQGNVHAKTGTLGMVRSLSGYATTADGHLLIFSMLANNWTVNVREVERVQDAIAVRLTQMQLAR